MAEANLISGKQPKFLDRIFGMVKGVAAIIDLTTSQLRDQSYGRAPDYEIISKIALDRNPYFASTFRFFESEDIAGLLNRAPFMIILMGIIGTFAGFYLALGAGGDIKSGAAVSIVSSLVGLPVSLLMDYINTLFPDQSRYEKAFNTFKVSLEILFNHELELSNIKKGRRSDDAEVKSSGNGSKSAVKSPEAGTGNAVRAGKDTAVPAQAKQASKQGKSDVPKDGPTKGRKSDVPQVRSADADDDSLVFGAPRS